MGVKDDGVLGAVTLDKLKQENPADLMRRVSLEQLNYERQLKAKDARREKFYPGLENRVMNRNAAFGQFRASA
jgi:lysozyme family protein